MLIDRALQEKIEQYLLSFPVTGVLGPRQVGKTTLVKNIAKKIQHSVYFDLEDPTTFEKFRHPKALLRGLQDKLIIIDEIQKKPELFELIRVLVDEKKKNGRFLLLGSASPYLVKKTAESLAGRIIYHELTPFQLCEVGESTKNMQKLLVRGGYPDSFLADSDENSFLWRENFIKSFLERDIPQLGIQIPATKLRRFWTMLAHNHGQVWNASQIAASMGISPPTSRHYLDILSDTFVIKQLLPYHTNIKKRLIKSPKIYIHDTGLLHTLLNVTNLEGLYGHPIAGTSFEGLVLAQILPMLPVGWDTFFYRTKAGAEIDLLIQPTNSKPLIPIEVKFSLAPKLSRGFYNSIEQLNCPFGIVVYPGDDIYPLKDNIFAVPAFQASRVIQGLYKGDLNLPFIKKLTKLYQ